MTTACIDCGSRELQTCMNRGVQRKRTRCPACYSAYNARRLRENRAAVPKTTPEGWRVVESARKLPPAGITRVVIDSRSKRITLYHAGLRRTWAYGSLKVLNHRIKLWAFYESRGYTLTERRPWKIVLEKRVAA